MGRSNKQVVEGPSLKRVNRIIECLKQGCSDDELAIKIQGVGMPLEIWSRRITNKDHLARVLDVARRYAGRRVEGSVRSESAVA